jgi:hypothetical protein
MNIGDKQFKSKKSLEEYVRSIIVSIGICSSIKSINPDYYNFFIDLFRMHPKYPEKIYNIYDLSITANKISSKQFELNIIREDGSTDDISWRNCIYGEKDNFKTALRVSIDDQIKQFRNNNNKNECALCKTTDAISYHVDHENHFEEILFNFLQHTKMNKPTIFQNAIDNRKAFTSQDKEYDDAWKTFHKENARLRILCSSCNLRRPKWKNV